MEPPRPSVAVVRRFHIYARSIALASRIYLYSIIHAGVFGSLYSIYSNLFFLDFLCFVHASWTSR